MNDFLDRYSKETSEYAKNIPSWHAEHSEWKARNILHLLKKNNVNPQTIAEIGCGAGEILNQMHSRLSNNVEYFGYDIAPDAIKLAKQREKERLSFYLENLFETSRHFDLLLMIDVCEHVENYYDFLLQCKKKADYMVVGIPLDISFRTILRSNNLTVRRNIAGHIHFFCSQSALLMLENCNFEIMDCDYYSNIIEDRKCGFLHMFFDFIVRSLCGRRRAADIAGDYTLYALLKC